MKTRCSRCFVASASLLAFAAGAAASDLTLRTVVLSGDAAPGLPGLTFEWFSDPRVAAPASTPLAPKLAFWADLAGTGVTESNNGSIWSDRSGSLALILRESDRSPAGGGVVFGALPSPAFNNDGRIAFTASHFDPAQPTLPTNLGIYAEQALGTFNLQAREGQQAPGLPPGTNFSNLPISNFNGAQAFHANKGVAAWVAGPGGTLLRLAALTPIPGTNNVLGNVGNPVLSQGSGSGMIVPGTVTTAAAPTGQPIGTALLSGALSGSFTTVAATGGTVGTTAMKYKEVSASPALVHGTQPGVAFWASLSDGGVTSANDTAIFATPPFSTGPRVREGDAAPRAGAGVFFSGFSRQLAIDGPVFSLYFLAFRASIVGEGVSNLNNSGIWLTHQTGAHSLIAREGEQVPRLPAGTLYASFSDPIVNSFGQVAFLARLRGTGVTPPTSLALMMTERCSTSPGAPAGRVAPIVRTGDLFPVAPGDNRIVDEIIADMGQAGAGFDSLADAGLLFFKLGFRDPIIPPPPPPQLAFRYTQGLFTATVRCLADVNADGALTAADFGSFQTSYVLGDLRKCDFNGDGVLSVADFGAFQTAFVQGCP